MKNKALLQLATGMVIQLCSCVNYSRPRVSTRSQWAKSGPPVFVDSFLEIQACIYTCILSVVALGLKGLDLSSDGLVHPETIWSMKA